MMKRVFLDTNVVLDILLQREGYQYSSQLLQMSEDRRIVTCQSALSLANIAYIARKFLSPGVLSPTLKQLSILSEILPLTESVFSDAIMMEGPDFEDILQLVCASHNNCDVLITNNVKHFKIGRGMLPSFRMPEIATPESFLLEMEL